jgi:hypothetical protein
MDEKGPRIPKYRHGVSLREVPALGDMFKEFSANGELESEIVLCPRLEPFVKFDLQWKEKNVSCAK